MTTTQLNEVTNQIQKFWAARFTKRLRENMLLPSLVNKEYQGEIKQGGDTVYVSQIVDIAGETQTIDSVGAATTFDSEKLTTTRITIQANKRAVAALEFPDLVTLQSQIDQASVQDTMRFAIEKQINTYLYSLVNPSTSAPDHLLSGNSAMSLGLLGDIRQLAGEAKWPAGNWYGLMSPAYWNDVLTDTTMASALFTNDAPVVNGQASRKLLGFNCYEDNSRTGTFGLFFHPDWVHLVQQTEVQVKVSDLHANKRFGVLMSVDVIFGAALGNQGDVKHVKVYNS